MWQGVSDIFTQILSVLQKSKGVLPCFTPREKPDGVRRVIGLENRVGDVKEGEGGSRGSRSSKGECAESGSEEKQQRQRRRKRT